MSATVNTFSTITTNNTGSVLFWTMANPINQTHFNLGITNDNNNRQFAGHVPWGDDTVYFDTGGCCDEPTERVTSSPHTDLNTWVHWAFIKDGDDKYIYKNGVEILFQDGTATADIGVINFVSIGNFGPTTPNGVIGLIDDVGIYDHALSASEVNFARLNGVTAIPEPTSLSLVALGLMGFAGYRIRKRKQQVSA